MSAGCIIVEDYGSLVSGGAAGLANWTLTPLGHAAEQADRAGVRRARCSQTGTFVAWVLVRRESFRGGERRELHAVGVS